MTDALEKVLQRDFALSEGVDPLGHKWGISNRRQTTLYYIGVLGEDEFDKDKKVVKEPAKYPMEYMSGHFTKPELAQLEINKYLNEAWNKSDKATQHSADRARSQEKREATKLENEKLSEAEPDITTENLIGADTN